MKIIIIGSVAAGTSVAAKARRNTEDAEIVVYDQGKDISYSVCGIPYQIGGEVESIETLTPRNASWFKVRYNVDIKTEHQVVSVDHQSKAIQVKEIKTGVIKKDHYDVLVFATGARPFTPPPFDQKAYHNVFQVRNIDDNRHIKAYINQYQPKNVLIVGAGFIGLEMTEQLKRSNMNVTLLQMESQVMPQMDEDMTFHIEEKLRAEEIDLILADTVKTIEGDLTVDKVITHKGQERHTDLVILATGVRPNAELAESIGIKRGSTGAIKVNRHMETNISGVYAVGDVAESFSLITDESIYRPLGSTANKMGRIAGDVITGGTLSHRGVLGTGIFRLFDLHVGQTGLTEKEAIHAGFDVQVLHNIKPAHAPYLDGKEMVIKAVADRESGRLLGAQIVGASGVDKRIDVIATAISFKAKVADLFHLDLAYAPPFSTTKDPILYTGMILDNALNDVPLLTPKEIIAWQESDKKIQIIDTRSEKDFLKNHIEGAVHIPLKHLRERLGELDHSVPTLCYCNKGTTGNAAQNVLLNNGFKEVYNISGGNKNYHYYKKMLSIKETL